MSFKFRPIHSMPSTPEYRANHPGIFTPKCKTCELWKKGRCMLDCLPTEQYDTCHNHKANQ